jgi:hypothetical protein
MLITIRAHRVLALGASLACAAVACAPAARAQGVFPPWPGAGSRLGPWTVEQSYDNPPATGSFPAICNDVDIGPITWQMGRLRLSAPNFPNGDVYSPYIRFGFDRNSNNCCPPGYYQPPEVQYRWIQIVRTNDPVGGQPANQWFVDYARGQTGNPFYSQQDVGRWGFTTAAEDLPTRQFPTPPAVTTWEAATTLVCVLNDHIGLIHTFYWGFTLEAGVFSKTDPVNLGAPSQLVEDTIRSDPNLKGWTLDRDCCCVPAPATLAVLLLTPLATARRRAPRA